MRQVLKLLAFCALLGACAPADRPVVVHPADETPDRLSDWGVVFADGARFKLNDGVVPYELNTPLFSDYALKLRTVWLPPGTSARYSEKTELQFPVGTIISKTFHYAKADESSAGGIAVLKLERESALDADGYLDLDEYVLIETRLLVRYADGWRAFPYVWNATQDEATLELAGEQRGIELVGNSGSDSIVYIVPDANQCGGCHTPDHSAKEIRPLGPKAWQLNRAYSWWGSPGTQLEHWAASGMLSGYGGTAPQGVRWSVPGDASLEQRAKAYLDANCAHCHNPAGAADTSGLHLNIDAPLDRHYGICKPPVAVGRGSGDRSYDIHPGKPDDSIMLYRMQHSDPAIAMPELGRSAIHAQGVLMLQEWIAAMPGEC